RDDPRKRYYAATLWREAAVTVQRETQLYAYVADAVAPTSRAKAMGRDHQVVRFPGQPIDPSPAAAPRRPAAPKVAPRAPDEPPQIAGFIGRVPLSAELVAQRAFDPELEPFDAREFVDAGARRAARRP